MDPFSSLQPLSWFPLKSSVNTYLIPPAHLGGTEDFLVQLTHKTLPAKTSRGQREENQITPSTWMKGEPLTSSKWEKIIFEIFLCWPVEGSHVSKQQPVQCNFVMPIPVVLQLIILPAQLGGCRHVHVNLREIRKGENCKKKVISVIRSISVAGKIR